MLHNTQSVLCFALCHKYWNDDDSLRAQFEILAKI
jgi:hypothetical protein